MQERCGNKKVYIYVASISCACGWSTEEVSIIPECTVLKTSYSIFIDQVRFGTGTPTHMIFPVFFQFLILLEGQSIKIQINENYYILQATRDTNLKKKVSFYVNPFTLHLLLSCSFNVLKFKPSHFRSNDLWLACVTLR